MRVVRDAPDRQFPPVFVIRVIGEGTHVRQARWIFGLILLHACGCVATEVGVRNPVPGLTTVAVAPFFNLSAEPTVDGRQFANAYFAELQKTPGFQVLPVGVAERAILQHGLQLSDPADALRLADILGVDAIVVGAVTDYDPYYPPRVGLQVSWYSPDFHVFSPGVPVDPNTGRHFFHGRKQEGEIEFMYSGDCPPNTDCEPAVVRGQSGGSLPNSSLPPAPRSMDPTGAPPTTTAPTAPSTASPMPYPGRIVENRPIRPASLEPLMSYTRLFDGSDARLTARLRDYVELSGDLRSGGWEGYLHRSDDFIRFTAHLMVVEMLQLHGGELRRRFVWMSRKHE